MLVSRALLSTILRKTTQSLSKATTLRALCSVEHNVLKSSMADVEIPKIAFPELIISKCEKFGNLVATECGITGRKYTYSEMLKKSKNLSKALRKKLNLQVGDVVALILPNIPEFPVAALGVLQAGLIITTVNPAYTQEEIARQLADSSTRAIITINGCWNTAIASCTIIKKQLPILVIKTNQSQSLSRGAIDFREFTDNIVDYPEIPVRNHEDVAFLPYSSGTTGLPKGVELTNFNLTASICENNSPELEILIESTESHQDVVPVILPMFHIYGFSVNTFFALSKGSKIVTLPKFTPDDYVNILRNHKPNLLALAPPVVIFLTNHTMVKPEDLKSVRLTISGAAPLGSLDEQRFLEKAGTGVQMVQGYGLTEASPGVTMLTRKLKSGSVNSSGSIGAPLPNTLVKVVAVDDPTGTPLGPKTPGELLVKGPQVMKGYLNRPEESKKAFLDGWLRTGDMVQYNDDRLLFVTDRLKELIKVKGFQVAPAELEEIIRDFPNVEDAAVIGIPDARLGEAPRAYIVPKKNTTISGRDLTEYVKKKVSHHKQLAGGVAVVDTIPKNASGKILRRTLKLEYERSLGVVDS